MALIKKHTIQYDNGNTKTAINFLGIPVISHEIEKESNTIEARLSRIDELLKLYKDWIERVDMRTM